MTRQSKSYSLNKKSDSNLGQGLVLILVFVAVIVIIILSLLSPSIGNVFSQVVTDLQEPESNNIPPQPVVFKLVGGTSYPSSTEIKLGSIEIRGIPNRIRVDTDLIVKAIIVPDSPVMIIGVQQTPSTDNSQSLSFSSEIEIFPRMSAALYGSGFEIEPKGKLEQRTDIGQPVEWIWTVNPKEPGDNLALNLEISVPVEVQNTFGNLEESYLAIANYPFKVQVLGETGLPAYAETLVEWFVRLLGLGVVLGVIRWIYSLGKRLYTRMRKGKGHSSNNETEAQSNIDRE